MSKDKGLRGVLNSLALSCNGRIYSYDEKIDQTIADILKHVVSEREIVDTIIKLSEKTHFNNKGDIVAIFQSHLKVVGKAIHSLIIKKMKGDLK